MTNIHTFSADQIREHVLAIINDFSFPGLKKSLKELKALHHCALIDDELVIELKMPFIWHSGFLALQQQKGDLLQQQLGVTTVKWLINYDIATLKRANNQPAVRGVKNIIAVSSGKGGVGKSTTSVNLALALSVNGAKVGILDADIYGPSIPLMLGTGNEKPTSPDGEHMAPIMAHGLATNSIGYLLDTDNAAVWRGPMASKALMQILNDTLWPELDYLVLDMPPGTGDIQLTLSQNIPVTGAVIVTTPQDVALVDAVKGLTMFEKVNIPVLGVIENMSIHVCSHCGHHEAIFGSGGAEKMVEKFHTHLLGQMPLHIHLRQDLDQGTPTVIARPESEFSQFYRQLADRIAAELYWQGEVIPAEILFRQVN